MWYVYSKHIKSGRVDCVNRVFDTEELAVRHIAACYRIDETMGMLGEYYYYLKGR